MMRLSLLQRFILMKSYRRSVQSVSRQEYNIFYKSQKSKPKAKDRQNIITNSIERLIDKELAIGHGRRTPHKWFIDALSLTAKGKRLAKRLQGEQQVLPITNMHRSKNNK
ncbi:MAG: hypothetical protein V1838_01730 [Patescibacteria group bacterium]